MKILITGSHFTPAQATIAELKKMMPEMEITYLGRKTTLEGDKTKSVESKVLPMLGINFIPIISGRIPRSVSIPAILSVFKILIGAVQAIWLIISKRPNIVLSFGGYVAVPVVVSAWLFSVPIIIHEQTLVTGLANRISSWFADKIAVSFKTEFDFPKTKIILTGNPMRMELQKPELKKVPKNVLEMISNHNLPLILIAGGNQGSHIINQTVAGFINDLSARYLIIHQTGDSKFNDYQSLLNLRKSLDNPENYLVKKWLDVDELGWIYKNCDLVITRAGINTLLEVNYFKLKNIVIPIKNHYEQNVNADYFSKFGLSVRLTEDDLILGKLSETVNKVFKKSSHVSQLTTHITSHPDAAKHLALETLLLGSKIR